MLRYRTIVKLCTLFLSLAIPAVSMAVIYPIPTDGSNIIGENQIHSLKKDETLSDIARKYNIGYYELLEANPQLNPKDLLVGTELLIPTQFILPNAPHRGIVVNIAELRLYYYLPDQKNVLSEPVGIGKRGWETPTGTARIIDHRKDPTWTAPQSVRDDLAKRGIFIPPVTPPGPDNPLGKYAMRISIPGYVIHGTNRPAGVGRRVSAGCFRLYPEGIELLFNMVDIGEEITIVNQVFKTGWSGDGRLFLEVHRPLFEQRKNIKGDQIFTYSKEPLAKALEGKRVYVNWEKVRLVGRQQTGIPMMVGNQDNAQG